ncbi:integrase catalytic domain-containing protein [Trichonephila clavipes]|nr:integrase catalytic domain-containing protein [Trichonephila clavipes]
MNKLLNLGSVRNSLNIRALRRFYDELEINIRSLESLNVVSGTYGQLLCPVLLKLIPEDISLEYNRKRKANSKFDVSELVNFIKTVVECRENSKLLHTPNKYSQEDVEIKEQNLCNSIFKALMNLDEFQLTLNNSEASFSEGENVVSKTTFQKRITLDRNFSSEETDQHSPFQQHPVSNAPLPSVQGHLSKSCPNHSRGPRCLSCNLYGNKSFECRRANLNNTSTPPSGVNAVHKLPSPINMCKDVTIFGRKLKGSRKPLYRQC